MSPRKFLLLIAPTILFTIACLVVGEATQPTPTALPTEPWRTATPRPTLAAAPAPFSTNPNETPIPVWVTDFAKPILATIADRKPNFQDDFSQYRGWRNVTSKVDGYVYAERFNETLFLNLPEKTAESFYYNPRLDRSNFVLALDLRFFHNQPEDTVRFQFDQSPNWRVVFDLSNNRKWGFQWGAQGNPQIISGAYAHFPPEHIPLTFIMQGTQCAVFINNDPLIYANDCGVSPGSSLNAWKATFHLLRDHGQAVIVNFDDLKLWDLDRIALLP